ncbi:polyhydroxybutyrate depolymerase [Xaviernesmea oryzae]|uniref:Polyhydroxybutyrate depolymerase n=2 Tax=Xaviernesmea oryzae TaxID=464029 RepID=A0A1X7CTF1_9HYPH|nr:polyhydroxybutyrate depolymerase [Xaviernesmea oryzae]
MDFVRIAGSFSSPALTRATAVGAFFLAACLASDGAYAGCGQPMQPGRHPIAIETGGVARSALYFVPSSYTGNDKVPVVFDFHGSNSNPQGQLNRSSWDKVAEKNGFIVLAPQGSLPGKTAGTYAWNVPFVTRQEGGLDEIAFIRQSLKTVKETFCVDPARIYASGYSGGGRMLSAYLCSGHDDFAAAGFVHSLRAGRPVEINGKWEPDDGNCSPARPVSIMAFAGVKDTSNPYGGGGSAYWQYGFKIAVERWTELDGCKGNGDPKTVEGVTFSLYGTCKSGARIASYVFANGTHDWPKPAAATEAVIAAAKETASVAKVTTVAAVKPAFDPNVDPASRMWEFFGRADSTDVIATAAPAKPKSGTGIASDCTTETGIQGTTCSSSQPIDTRRSGQGVQDAL